jgi:polyisoprenoid-binding protein YceI
MAMLNDLLRRRRSARRASTGALELSAVFPTLSWGGGLLSCQLRSENGQPLPGAGVTLTDAMGRQVAQGETDPYGTYVVSLSPGEYRLSAGADGYLTHRETVLVEAGEHTGVGPVALERTENSALPPVGRWRIDPEHSTVRFTARHLALSRIHGRFNEFEGHVYVADPMDNSALQVVVNAASLDTNNRMRDAHLRSADFFDVERFPRIEFTSSRFSHRSGSRWTVQGGLTLHGVTRSVSLDTRYLGTGPDQFGGVRTAAVASAELHREDFTLNWREMFDRGIAIVGTTIEIEIDIQAVLEE